MKIYLKSLIFVLAIVLFASFVSAQNDVTIYYFWGDGCPHCAEAKPFLEELEDKYPELTVKDYETWNSKENAELFVSMSSACGTSVVGVPTIFVDHKSFIGFDSVERKGREIEEAVKEYIKNPNVDLMDHLGENLTTCPSQEHEKIVDLPFFGEVDTTKISLPAFTVMVGLLDGFNPCAMWVLLFLLALLVYTKSRKKMFIVGGIFILTSGIVYYFFMAAWLNMFLFIGLTTVLRVLVGLAAVFMGAVNMKDFFAFKKGFSLSIPDKFKPKLFKKMRFLVHEAALPATLLGVITLAFTVNLIELLCTAGFPMIYTRILTLNNLPAFQYYSYLLLYILMYMLDDFIVFTIAVITLSSKKLTAGHGKALKLIAGLMMLILGLIMLIKPELLAFG